MNFYSSIDRSLREDLVQKTKQLWNFARDDSYYLRIKGKMAKFRLSYATIVQSMVLCLKEYEKNFRINYLVINKEYYPIKDPKGQFWKQSKIQTDSSPPVSTLISFKFQANDWGTYYQTLVFRDTAMNYYRTHIIVDYIHPDDEECIKAADAYVTSQLQLITETDEPIYWHSYPEPHKMLLERTYPKMSQNTLLSIDTLTDKPLNRRTYKNVMKQLIGIEEMCRLAHISRFNCTKTVPLLESYKLGDSNEIKFGRFLILLQLDQDGTEDSAAGTLLLQSCEEVDVTIFSLDITIRLRIEDRSHNCIGLRLCPEILQRHWTGKQELKAGVELEMRFTFVQNRIPFCQWQLAVDLLPDTRLIFPPPESPFDQVQVGEMNTGDECLDNILNYQQKIAVTRMMEVRQNFKPPILIVGAFGTGKTFTIAHGIKRILETEPDAKILLCTHSNSAADLYVREYFDRWYTQTGCESFKPLRIYYPERVMSTVNVDVRKYCLLNDNDQFRNPTNEDISSYKIIVTTLVTSFSLLNLDLSPTHIVIDEAAQALECEAIMPMTKATPSTQLILAGDNRQMQPEVYSHLANLRGFRISLLERLNNLYEFNNMNKITLRTNYRSHPKIVDIVNGCMYERGLLKNLPQKHLPEEGSFQFIHVCGTEMKTQHSTGYYNAAEVDEIVHLVQQTKLCWNHQIYGRYGEGSIGIFAHYSEQVAAIRSALRKVGMHEVSVERIQNVQGKQFSVVFISTVITRQSNRLGAYLNVRNYGFLTDKKLLTTAITRARNSVTIVGDLLALTTMGSCQSAWRFMLQSCDHIGGITQEKLYKAAEELITFRSSPLNPDADPFIPVKNNDPSKYNPLVVMPVCYPVYFDNSTRVQSLHISYSTDGKNVEKGKTKKSR